MLLVTVVMLVIMVMKIVTLIMEVVAAVTKIFKSHNATGVVADPVGIAVL
jgi:hypothetical protein